jgi:hypothetical protein
MAKNPLVALAFSRALVTGVATEQYDQAPRAMRESLIFPYLQGSEWATQLYRKGGWAMVSNAFTHLPLSSEQILHVDKYYKYERPIKIVLPDVTNLLSTGSNQQPAGATERTSGTAGVPPASVARGSRRGLLGRRPSPGPQGPLPIWHRIDSDVNGEWTYYLILDQFLNLPAESKRAAAGWGGDRYALYEGPNGQVFLAQVAVWDTEDDAREFFDAYIKRTELRYPGAKQLNVIDSSEETRNSKPETRNRYSWQTSEGEVVMELRGQRVVILEGIPPGVVANSLLKAF